MQQCRYQFIGTVESCLMRQLCQLVQVVCHSYKVAHHGCLLCWMLRHYLCIESRFTKELRKASVCLLASMAQAVVIYLGEFYRDGFWEFSQTSDLRSASWLCVLLVIHVTVYILISHFTVSVYVTICDRWERIAPTLGVGRGFSASRKITSPPPKTEVCLALRFRMSECCNAGDILSSYYNFRHCSKSLS